MDFQVPLNKLKFGQDDGAGINARVAGRLDGIEALAANLYAVGQIENLVVKRCDGDFYSVSNGNRRLAAFRQIHGDDGDVLINCTLRDVNEAQAFEDSLITAVTAQQLHPVDQYEAFARLKESGSTDDEIAQRYGMKLRQVEQAMALGALAPAVRDAWRKGEIKAEAAQGFTLALDHDRQDKALADLREQYPDMRNIDSGDVKSALQLVAGGAGVLVEFIGIDAYTARGGTVTRDLFGTDHQVSDEKLAEAMAAEKLDAECAKLVAGGWSFAVPFSSVEKNHWNYGHLPKHSKITDAERQQLDELKAIFEPDDEFEADLPFAEMSPVQQDAYLQHRKLTMQLAEQSYVRKDMKKGGCFLDIDDNGHLSITWGRTKPVEATAAAAAEAEIARANDGGSIKSDVAAPEAAPAKEPTAISNALRDRLIVQLTHGTRDAIVAAIDTDLLKTPLAQTLAKIICSQIRPDQPHHMPDAIRTKMHAIRDAMPANLINVAIEKRFEGDDYFSSAPKTFVLKAVAEAINNDEARKLTDKTKADIAKYAKANVSKSGWLPKELRTPQYVGPKKTPAADAAPKPAAAKASTSPALTKKAAAAKKVAKKNTAKPAIKKPAKKASTKKKKA